MDTLLAAVADGERPLGDEIEIHRTALRESLVLSIINGTAPAPVSYERIVGTVLAQVRQPSAEWFHARYHDFVRPPEIQGLGALTPASLTSPLGRFESEPADEGGTMTLALVAVDHTWALLLELNPGDGLTIQFHGDADTCARIRASLERKDGPTAFGARSVALGPAPGSD